MKKFIKVRGEEVYYVIFEEHPDGSLKIRPYNAKKPVLTSHKDELEKIWEYIVTIPPHILLRE